MGKVLIIGAGGLCQVAAHKVAQHPEVFDEIMIAGPYEGQMRRHREGHREPRLSNGKGGCRTTWKKLVELLNGYKPDMVMNLALPYQDLTIMEACLQNRVQLSGYGKLRAEGRGSF